MIRITLLIAGLAFGSVIPAWAEAPVRSPRPDVRPVTANPEVAMIAATPVLTFLAKLRPVARPVVAQAPARIVLASSGSAIRLSPRPAERPQNLKRRSIVKASGLQSQPATPVLTGKRG